MDSLVNQKHSPTIFNSTPYSIVVFQERGVFFNKQILHPGESVDILYKESGGLLPYKIHAVVGDESCLPDSKKSLNNLASAMVIPAAFCAGAFAAAMTAGALSGPSLALAPLVSGMVVRGVVIDAAVITAGTVLAAKASVIGEMLVEKYPENFMSKTGLLVGGRRYIVIKGGLDKPLSINDVSKKEFKKLDIKAVKRPINVKAKNLPGNDIKAIEAPINEEAKKLEENDIKAIEAPNNEEVKNLPEYDAKIY